MRPFRPFPTYSPSQLAALSSQPVNLAAPPPFPCAQTLVILSYDAEESSMHVTLCTDGVDGSAGVVADRLRVLLHEELLAYKHLRYHMLAQVPGSESFVNLDELPKAGAGLGSVMLRGEAVSVETLKEEFAFWLTTRCEFQFVLAEKLRTASRSELPTFASLQELRRTKPSWLTRKLIIFEDALAGAYVLEYLALTYRWETANHPDPSGMQLHALQEYLIENPSILYVFIE